MRRSTVLLPVVVSLLAPTTAHAQGAICLEMSGGPLFEPSYVRYNLHVGWTAGIGISYDVRPEVQLVQSASYCRFPDGDWSEKEHEYWPWDAVGAGGRTWSPSLHDGYEVSAAVRLGAPAAPVGSYLSLRAGVQSAKLRREGLSLEPGGTREHHWEWVTKGFTSAGVGVTVPVQGNWKLLLESRLTMTTDGTAVFIPVVAGLQLQL